jgi:hypothetical protein
MIQNLTIELSNQNCGEEELENQSKIISEELPALALDIVDGILCDIRRSISQNNGNNTKYFLEAKKEAKTVLRTQHCPTWK